jgi:xanthine dehydrogenase accessory factor
MVVSESGDVLGSLSGGCVEGAVVAAALEVMDDGGPRREFFGYSPADAFAVGLTCGGGLEVHIELLADALGPLWTASLSVMAAEDSGAGLALIRRIDAGFPEGTQPPQGAEFPRGAWPSEGDQPTEGAGAVVIPDPASYQVAQSEAVAALLGIETGSGDRNPSQQGGDPGTGTPPCCRRQPRSSSPC